MPPNPLRPQADRALPLDAQVTNCVTGSSIENQSHHLLLARQRRAERRLEGIFRSVWWLTLITILLAGLLAWDGRYVMNPDGLSYMDMASNALAHGPGDLINSYWSPLYPALIMGVYLFHPGPGQDIAAVHLLNWILFALTTLCFVFFLRRWIATHRDVISLQLEPYFVPFAFSVFLLGCAQFITVSVISPDLCAAGFLFLAAGLFCRIASGECTWKSYAGLGLTLGLAYYVKTPMLTAGGVLIILLTFAIRVRRLRGSGRSVPLVAVSMLILIGIAAPMIILQSKLAGHLSIGESGPLSYLWCVNGVHPQDTMASPAAAEHLERISILSRRPVTVGFNAGKRGTYPLWYEPSYWFADTHANLLHFDVRAQLSAIRTNLAVFGGGIYYMSALCGGALFLLLARTTKRPARDRISFAFIAWTCAVFLMYGLVYVTYRYLGAFIVVFWIAGYGILLPRVSRPARAGVLATVACATLIATAALAARDRGSREVLDHLAVAQGLHRVGIQQGDAIANVGYSFNAYYARMAGVQLGAQIVDAAGLWTLDPEEFQTLCRSLRNAGIKAIVARDAPRNSDPAVWQKISGTRYHRYCVVRL